MGWRMSLNLMKRKLWGSDVGSLKEMMKLKMNSVMKVNGAVLGFSVIMEGKERVPLKKGKKQGMGHRFWVSVTLVESLT